MNSELENYILILLIFLSNLWNLSNSFKQFYFSQQNLNNRILKKLYTKIENFYKSNYTNNQKNLYFFQQKSIVKILEF